MKEGWKYEQMGNVCTFISGYTPAKELLSKSGSIPYYKVSDMNTEGNEVLLYKTSLYLSNTKKIIPQGSVVFPKNGGAIFTNKKRMLVCDSVVDLNTEAIFPNKNIVTTNFLYKLLLSIDLGQFDNGGGLPSINIKKMQSFTIPIPPLPEQERIVSLLDAEFAKIDAIKANAEKQLQDAKDLFQSKIEDCFSDTSDWDSYNISECFRSINNGANIKQTKGASGLPITRIETLSNGIFNANRLGYADIFDSVKYQKYILNEGDILMSHINSLEFVGRSVAFQNQLPIVIHGMNLLRLVPLSFIDSDFFVYLSKTRNFKKSINGITHKSVNQASFNTTALKAIQIKVPSIETQRQIVDNLNKMQNLCLSLQSNFDTTVNYCNDLKQSILKDIFS